MSSENDPKPTQAVPFVRRRKVFYIPGYDPFHPRRYRELYRKESVLQGEISGYNIALKRAEGGGPYGWHVDAKIGGQVVSSDFEVLVWSDIVKETMTQNIPRTYLMLARTAWTYIGSGAFSRLLKTRKGPMIAALYPIFMLTLQLLVACGLGMVFGNLTSWFLHGWLFAPIFALVLIFTLRGFRKIDNKLFAYYLMHDYAFSARGSGVIPKLLDARMTQFGDHIAAAFLDDVDEVLVVGHSSGAHLAITVLADLIRAGRVPVGGPRLAFLSLGQVVPMVSFLPDAKRLRADLAYLSAQDALTWVDVTAPGDGCAFALCDPVAVSGVAPADKRWPLVISAAFTQTLKPETWKALRWRFFRLHFQYLCAFDNPGDYDYFQITCGPLTLADRYRDRAPSKSRIETPLSKYITTS